MQDFDTEKFEFIHQVGGIRTGRFDWPEAGGSPGSRVALVNTGSGLRFTVALDRGGDIVEAFHRESSLAYLTPNGYAPPSHSLQHHDDDWLTSWPGGLVTTCGPRYIGPGREEDDQQLYLHGPHSNTPVALLGIHNPDPRRGDREMRLEMTTRDTRMYGPVVEVRRRISCTLGEPFIRIEDEVINLGNTTVPHNWLYHINFGYPLVDREAQVVLGGRVTGIWDSLKPPAPPSADVDLDGFKTVPDNLPDHAGTGSRGLVLDVADDGTGTAHVGIVNGSRGLGVEVTYLTRQMPRLANWQHYGPGGAYVCALEPFHGSLFGKDRDSHPLAAQWLDPGESRQYEVGMRVHDEAGVEQLLARDLPLVSGTV
ncbi:MAG: DUF4432 family protein [Lentisphaeria bacterium]|jgi:hypothetical protein|nr:DUF4432 family protein [Lentisphaeria bacterium]